MIVAFMQNMWLKDPERFWSRYHRTLDISGKEAAEKFRREFTRRALFYRCITGQRLTATFGKELCDRIIWEESTRRIGSKSGDVFPPDMKHMASVIKELQPKVIITFGKVATSAIPAVWDGSLVTCLHPAARGTHVLSELLHKASLLKEQLKH